MRGEGRAGAVDAGGGGLAVEAEALGAEDAEPPDAVEGRDDERAEDELAEGAAARDLGDEGSDEGGPRDPPAPVEDGPGAHPGRRAAAAVGRAGDAEIGVAELVEELEGVRVPGDLGEVPEVVAEGGADGVENEDGVAGEEDEEDEEVTGDEDGVREELDAVAEARDDRGGRAGGDDPDDADLGLGRVGDVEAALLALVDSHVRAAVEADERLVQLLHAEAERGAHAEEGAADRDDVDRVADRPAQDVVAEERLEARPHRRRVAAAERDEPDQRADRRVRDPAVEAPVEVGHHQGVLGAVVVVQLVPAALPVVVPHRLRDAVVEQPHADARREQHREPRQPRELGLLVVVAQLEGAVLGEAHVQQDEHPDVLRPDVEPAPLVPDPVAPARELVVRLLLATRRERDEAPDDRRRPERHFRVEFHVEQPDVRERLELRQPQLRLFGRERHPSPRPLPRTNNHSLKARPNDGSKRPLAPSASAPQVKAAF
mmetsp:Transcript_1494/g.4491  ORF Transcript_1494/g.4491 Transcript_1494/m.4491 type:complete len:487 (-) Transcript_1494:6-1466(-)